MKYNRRIPPDGPSSGWRESWHEQDKTGRTHRWIMIRDTRPLVGNFGPKGYLYPFKEFTDPIPKEKFEMIWNLYQDNFTDID